MFCLVWFDTSKRKLAIKEESEVSVFTENDGTEVEKRHAGGKGLKPFWSRNVARYPRA